MSILALSVTGDTWLAFIQYLVDLGDRPKSVVTHYYAQVYCYHIWKERNARAHDLGVFGTSKLLQGILNDVNARLHISIWFSKLVCSMIDLHTCIVDSQLLLMQLLLAFYLQYPLQIGYRQFLSMACHRTQYEFLLLFHDTSNLTKKKKFHNY